MGLLRALGGDPAQFKYFSQVTTLTVALTATAAVLGSAATSAGWARALAWCRGTSTTYAVVTAVIYQVLLSGAVVGFVVWGIGRLRYRRPG